MSFDAMAPYRNKETTHVWAVSKNGLVPIQKHKVAKETAKTFVLEDGTVVRKETMQNNYQMFYTNEASAEIVYRNIRKAFDPFEPECDSNFDVITNATIDTLPDILITMIHKLCEDGVPSAECVKEWLLSEPGKEQDVVNCEHTEQEDYSNLKDGDAIYYVNVEDNKVVQGEAFGVCRTNPDNSVKYLILVMPNDFVGCSGELLGDKIFLKKDLAENALKRCRPSIIREKLIRLNGSTENKKNASDRRTALDVAKYVVNTCIAIGHPISNSCLQHVLYELYKAAFRRGNTLFYDEFEASAVGPRISAVYDNFCAWGAWPITMEQKESDDPKKQIPDQFKDLFKVIICATVNTSLYDWIENAKHGSSAWYKSYVAKSTWISGAAIHQEAANTKDVYDDMLRNMQKEGLV